MPVMMYCTACPACLGAAQLRVSGCTLNPNITSLNLTAASLPRRNNILLQWDKNAGRSKTVLIPIQHNSDTVQYAVVQYYIIGQKSLTQTMLEENLKSKSVFQLLHGQSYIENSLKSKWVFQLLTIYCMYFRTFVFNINMYQHCMS